jgi:hypothetical protein
MIRRMSRRWIAAGIGSLALATTAATGLAKQATTNGLCRPTFTRIPETSASTPYQHGGAVPPGYVQAEYIARCVVGGMPYAALVNVRRPARVAEQSGIVVGEIWHWGDIWTVYPGVEPYFASKRDVYVVIATNALAVAAIKRHDPHRYSALLIPGGLPTRQPLANVTTPQEFTILAQIGAAIRSRALPDVKARKVILSGMSGSAGQLLRFIRQEEVPMGPAGAHTPRFFDGYLVLQTAASMSDRPIPDIRVPVVEVEGERELIVSFEAHGHRAAYRREDGPLYRLYEVPGMSHVMSRRRLKKGARLAPGMARMIACTHGMPSDFPQGMIWRAALDDLIQWVDRGMPAPHADRIATNADGSEIERDRFGNALGGLRSSYLNVPIARYDVTSGVAPISRTATRCDMIGSRIPLPAAILRTLYPTHADYVRKVDESVTALVSERWLLPADANVLRAEAQHAAVP